MPSISCVIPTHNNRDVSRTLDSIFNGNYRDGDQVTVVFDGCDVPALDSCVNAVRIPGPNRDFGAVARNAGLAASTCDLITYMDSDDVYVSNAWDVIRTASLMLPSLYRIQYLKKSRTIDFKCLFNSEMEALAERRSRGSNVYSPVYIDKEIPPGAYGAYGDNILSLFADVCIGHGYGHTDGKYSYRRLYYGEVEVLKSPAIGVYCILSRRNRAHEGFGSLFLQGHYGRVTKWHTKVPRIKHDVIANPLGRVVWEECRKGELKMGVFQTQNFVIPNVKDKIAPWMGAFVANDAQHIIATVKRFGGVEWRDEIICLKGVADKMYSGGK